MRSLTGNFTLHSIRSLLLCGAVACFTLSSCAAVRDQSLATLGPPPYFAINAKGLPIPANTSSTGRFAEENGCVVFRPADYAPAMTPVFPKGETAIVSDGSEWLGFYVRGAPVAMGKFYQLLGARSESSDGLALVAPAPTGCPARYIVVGNVGNAMVDAATGCAGVTVCRAYRVN